MDVLHKEFEKLLDEMLRKNPELSENFDVDDFFSSCVNSTVELVESSLLATTQDTLLEMRKASKEFVERNTERWSEAFELLETLLIICTEAGDNINNFLRPKAVKEKNLLFDLIVRHHARACHIAQEILCLLQNGFADAAHSRWRALHEVTATAMFISKHGKECAERFYFHDVIDTYNFMKEHKKYEDRLQEKGPSAKEITEAKEGYDELISLYGREYADNYGWASYLFPNQKKVGFASIEKDVGLDHMRPYYKWASQNIHAGSKGLRNRLGLAEAKEDVLLVGQSNSGMTDPAHAMAISLSQITLTLLMLEPNLDSAVMMKIITDYEQKVGDAFLRVQVNSSDKPNQAI